NLIVRTDRVTAATLAEQLASTEPPLVLDVRADREWQEKAIAGSLLIPLNHLVERTDEVTGDRKIVVYCATGYHSSIAASILEQNGITQVADLVGGIAAWEASKLETVGVANR
ncbi:MAG: rhodanese-like domain-containing protein, partial [Dehalococcoidia bacterium]